MHHRGAWLAHYDHVFFVFSQSNCGFSVHPIHYSALYVIKFKLTGGSDLSRASPSTRTFTWFDSNVEIGIHIESTKVISFLILVAVIRGLVHHISL